MNVSAVFDIAAALAVTALLAESYGFVRRRVGNDTLAPVVLGVLFGLMALVQMFNPFEPYEGLILDMRNIPIALAGAFLGWRGLLPCLLIAFATRFGIGGVGMVSGILGMAIAGLAGRLWAVKTAHLHRRGLTALLLLAAMMSGHLLAAVVLPRDIAIWFLSVAAGPIVLVNFLAVPVIGALLERENYRIRRHKRLLAAVTHDPETGLLTDTAFARELTNAYAAQPMGTFAGFLVVRPDTGFLSSVTGFLTRGSTVAMNAEALAQEVDHADLAGLCRDGSIWIPLSAREVENINRVKNAIRAAIRGNSRPGDTAGLIDMTLIVATDPEEFLRIAQLVRVSSQPALAALPASYHHFDRTAANDLAPARRAQVFDPEEHDALFAKANFLIKRAES